MTNSVNKGQFAAEEAFVVQQLRLEVMWLRQRLHAMAKLQRPGLTLPVRKAQASKCQCDLCAK